MQRIARVLSVHFALIPAFASAFLILESLVRGSANEKSRDAGRPRIFTDEAIFVATARAIARCGYSRLTLDEIAGELGCARQALARRFGSKHDLVRAYLVWVVDQTAIRFQQIRKEHSSPLAALRARFLLPTDEQTGEIVDLAGQANILFFFGASEVPEFRALLDRLLRVNEEEVTLLLQEARVAGELELSDARELAHRLIAATTGEISLWASVPDGPIGPRLARLLDAVLKPYQISGHSPPEGSDVGHAESGVPIRSNGS